ncbi:MAG: nucleotidyltransferase domain-containing protein [Nitrospinae bacterium]|nr:nucleotidyltransferase domain-containing protein [Nitrospinota bacterium]
MNPQTSFHQFGIDFSQVRQIPADPKVRLDYFRRFKDLLEQEREKIKVWHLRGAGGREVIQALTGLIDEVVRHVVTVLSELEVFHNKHLTDKFALVAVGGYGRGELNPGSDIDLLFLLQKKMDSTLDRFIQEIISVLWGIGLEIGQSCRTVKECQLLALDDPTIRTSMIETRFLTGTHPLYRKLWDSVRKNVIKKKAVEFLNENLKKMFAPSETREGVTSHPEPDIKNGPGGLRDYHAALWAVAVSFDGVSLQEIQRPDVVTSQELVQLEQSVNFLLRVRNDLHYLKGKKSDVLEIGLQKDLAAHLGYSEGNKGGDAESFMRDYFMHATRIRQLTEAIFQRCLEVKPTLKNILTQFKKKNLDNGFMIKRSKLSVQEFNENLFRNDLSLFLKVFQLCQEYGLQPDSQLNRLIRQNVDLVDSHYIANPKVGEFLFSLLSQPQSGTTLRLMHESGLLARLIPEFGQSQYRISYDLYHRYTADEQALRMVHFLEGLSDGTDEGLAQFQESYAESEENRVILKLACLLHSLEREGDESSVSKTSEALSRVFEHFALTPEQQVLLVFLIDQRHTLNHMAFFEDIHDPATIRKLGQIAEAPQKLGLLLLMSYAELNAVAPGTWTSWKKLLLTDAYQRTRNYLLRPDSLEQKPQTTRQAVYAKLSGQLAQNLIDQHLEAMPDDYLHTVDSNHIVDHIRLVEQKGDGDFAVQFIDHPPEDFFELTLCGQSNIGLFKNLVGTLTARALNILSAQIFSRKDGLAIIIVQVGSQEAITLFGNVEKVWQEIENNLKDLLDQTKTLGTLLKERTRLMNETRNTAAIEPRIEIENYPENPFTLIRIEARDHPGMLYKIAHAFRNFGIRPHRAKIDTRGGRGIDVFLISLDGRKLTFAPLLQRIKDTLIVTLLVEKLEDLE